MHIFLSRLSCLAIFRCDMFEPVQDMFFSTYFHLDCVVSSFLIRYV